DGKRLRGVWHIGQVDFDPLQLVGTLDRNGVVGVDDGRSHLSQHVTEAYISLQAALAQSVDDDPCTRVDRRNGEKVGGVAGVGLNLVGGRTVDVAWDNDASGVAGRGVADQ